MVHAVRPRRALYRFTEQEYRERCARQGNATSYPRLQQGRRVTNRPPPMASGILMPSPAHVGILPIPAAWSNENQLPAFTAAPHRRRCIQAAIEPTEMGFFEHVVVGVLTHLSQALQVQSQSRSARA